MILAFPPKNDSCYIFIFCEYDLMWLKNRHKAPRTSYPLIHYRQLIKDVYLMRAWLKYWWTSLFFICMFAWALSQEMFCCARRYSLTHTRSHSGAHTHAERGRGRAREKRREGQARVEAREWGRGWLGWLGVPVCIKCTGHFFTRTQLKNW